MTEGEPFKANFANWSGEVKPNLSIKELRANQKTLQVFPTQDCRIESYISPPIRRAYSILSNNLGELWFGTCLLANGDVDNGGSLFSVEATALDCIFVVGAVVSGAFAYC